jgi:hypothetical protein
MMEALLSTETSVLIRAVRCNIQEDSILHSHRREKLKSYVINPMYFILFFYFRPSPQNDSQIMLHCPNAVPNLSMLEAKL